MLKLRTLLLASFLLSWTALAGEPLSLRSALDRALSQNGFLAAGGERIAVATGFRRQAGLKPNPRFVFQSENNRAWGTPAFSYGYDADTFAYVSQPIEASGKRRARLEFADAGIERSVTERDQMARQIAARVGAAYWTAAGAVRVRDLLHDELVNFNRVVEYTRNRVQEGAAAGADLLRIEIEYRRIEALYLTAAQDAESGRISLFSEMGVPDIPAVHFSDSLAELRAFAAPGVESAIESRAEIRNAKSIVELARRNLRLQQTNARPDLEVVGGYKRTSGYNTVLAGVQFTLPVRNRNQGLIESAHAEIRAGEATLLALRKQIESEIASAQKDYESRRSLVSETLPDMLRRSQQASQIAEAAYREGGVDPFRLLDAERSRIEAQLLYNRALAGFQQSLVHLQVVTGAFQ